MSASAGGRRGWIRPVDVVDVFGYVVILNLTAQYVPSVMSETFMASLLTAILLKAVLEVVVAVKDRLKARFTVATTGLGKVLAGLGLWLVLIGSKFVVLELVDYFFGSSVSLGGFWAVTGLILVLMLARAGVRQMLGEPFDGSR